MPPNLRLTRLAGKDLEEILDYTITTWGMDHFRRYRKMLFEGIAGIAGDPHHLLSKSRDDLFEGARIYPVGRHFLLYYVSGEQVILARILHKQMDLSLHLEDL